MSGDNILKPLSDALASVKDAMQILVGEAGKPRLDLDFSPSALMDRLLQSEFIIREGNLPPAYQFNTEGHYDWHSYGQERALEVYSDSYMDKFIGLEVPGADNPRLNTLMTDLLQTDLDSPEALSIVREMAGIRGIPEDQFIEQFERYKQILHEGNGWDGSQHFLPKDYLKDDFMGSTAHLRYGSVVGDVIGLDPVFAGMMNPTGGIVGPGEFGQAVDPETALSYHGIFHDAGGFLHNYLNLGPGYDYLTFDTKGSSPLEGQVEGVLYWQDKMNVGLLDGAGDLVEWGAHFLGDGVHYGFHEGGESLDELFNQLGGWTNEGFDDLGGSFGFIPGAEDFFDQGGDVLEDIFDQSGDFVEDFGADLGSGAEWLIDQWGVGLDDEIDEIGNAFEEVGGIVEDAWEQFSSLF
jgi:hypothetical protein